MAGKPHKPAGSFAVYVHIPKTAGLTVTETLKLEKLNTLTDILNFFTADRPTSFGHFSLVALQEAGLVTPKQLKNALIFTVVRNPYGRAISLFNYLQQELVYAPPPTGDSRVRAIIGEGVVEESQTEFIRFLETVRAGVPSVGLYNRKGLSQCNRQVDWLEGIDLDFVARFEDLESDLATIAETLYARRAAVCTTNVTRFGKVSREKLLTERAVALIQEVYAEDFRALGYSTDPAMISASPDAADTEYRT